MRLTKTTSHAIRIAIDCAASEGRLVKAAELSKRLDISQLNVFKIIHLMQRAGYLEAMRGQSGGVRLAKPAGEIRIGDIVRAMEATEMEVAGAAESSSKRGGKPQINAIFDNALEAFITVLDQHTLADMLASTKPFALEPTEKARKTTPRVKKATIRPGPTLRG